MCDTNEDTIDNPNRMPKEWREQAIAKFDGYMGRAEHLHPALRERVLQVLEACFWAIEDGSANSWLPDPDSKRFDEEQQRLIIEVDLDTYIDWEVAAHYEYWEKPEHGCIDRPANFGRLKGPAREAFCQKLHEAFYPTCYRCGQDGGVIIRDEKGYRHQTNIGCEEAVRTARPSNTPPPQDTV